MLFSALIAAFVSSHVQAFTLLPSSGISDARWRDMPVQFHVNYEFSPYSQSQLNGLIEDAFRLWNGVPTSTLQLELGGSTDIRSEDLVSGRATESAIVFDPNFQTNIGADSSVLAVGTAIHVGERFEQGFIVINTFARGVSSNPERLRVILAHEVGHTFGLGHTNDEAALMYPFAQSISELGQDDVNGVSYLYPRKDAIDNPPFGCGMISHDDGGGRPLSDGGLLATAWMAAFLLAWVLAKATGPVRG